ncbi:MAG: ribonuclease HII [Opitutaceae bacterium]|nr:ribonuclease HII [Opitutaceae bacterium]
MLRDCHGLVGVDEAGRGALAGPVVAGAVLVNRAFLDSDWCRRYAPLINDSKQLTAEQREHIYERMDWLRSEHRIIFAAGTASVAEIEQENILGATRLAMRRAIETALASGRVNLHPPDPLFTYENPPALAAGEVLDDWKVLVDGKPIKNFGFAHKAIVEGDAKSLAIAMASIVAKVTRDRLMDALDVEAQGYGFARHKGYATPQHRAALLTLGPGVHHRKLFVSTFLKTTASEAERAQTQFAFEDEQDAAVAEEPSEAAPRPTEAAIRTVDSTTP